MKVVIQRTSNAKCIIDNNEIASIKKGLVLLVGFGEDDENVDLDWYVNKIVNMRIFEDENNKMNLNVKAIGGSILSISQFTLYGNCTKGNRPSFIEALNPDIAKIKYEQFNKKLSEFVPTQIGKFGADMKINFINDGPVTIILEKKV
ncbi:MAG: D-aminoacyl-tRNA deacylase [Bacilli bacterium]